MARYRTARRFKDAFNAKPPKERAAVSQTLDLLESNPRHPSLRVKRFKSTPDVWEARINKPNRLTFHWDQGVMVLRFNCRHDVVYRNP